MNWHSVRIWTFSSALSSPAFLLAGKSKLTRMVTMLNLWALSSWKFLRIKNKYDTMNIRHECLYISTPKTTPHHYRICSLPEKLEFVRYDRIAQNNECSSSTYWQDSGFDCAVAVHFQLCACGRHVCTSIDAAAWMRGHLMSGRIWLRWIKWKGAMHTTDKLLPLSRRSETRLLSTKRTKSNQVKFLRM